MNQEQDSNRKKKELIIKELDKIRRNEAPAGMMKTLGDSIGGFKLEMELGFLNPNWKLLLEDNNWRLYISEVKDNPCTYHLCEERLGVSLFNYVYTETKQIVCPDCNEELPELLLKAARTCLLF